MIAHHGERNLGNQELPLEASHRKCLKSLLFIFLSLNKSHGLLSHGVGGAIWLEGDRTALRMSIHRDYYSTQTFSWMLVFSSKFWQQLLCPSHPAVQPFKPNAQHWRGGLMLMVWLREHRHTCPRSRSLRDVDPGAVSTTPGNTTRSASLTWSHSY